MRQPIPDQDSSAQIFFLSAVEPGTNFDREALVRLVALGNLDPTQSLGALCIFDAPGRQADDLVDRLRLLTEEYIDPPLGARFETLRRLPSGVVLLATGVDTAPPHVVARAVADVHEGDCWVYRNQTIRRAGREDLDSLYGAAAVSRRLLSPEEIAVLLGGSLADCKSVLTAGRSPLSMLSLLPHRLVSQAGGRWGSADNPTSRAAAQSAVTAAADRILTLGLVALGGCVKPLRNASARALRALCLFDRTIGPDPASAGILADEILSRYYLLGAFGTHIRDWRAVSELIQLTVPGLTKDEFPLVDHPLFRSGSDRTLGTFFDRAYDLAKGEPVWIEEFGDEDNALVALAQFDLLAAAASPASSDHYPNFARSDKTAVAPVVRLVKERPSAFSEILGPNAAGSLESYLVQLESDIGRDFTTFGRWWSWGYSFDQLTP